MKEQEWTVMCKYSKEIIPDDMEGLENFKFVELYGIIYVYHFTLFRTPLSGREVKGWLCCTEGWKLKSDGKYHETIRCGFMPDRVVDTMADIFDYYRKMEENACNLENLKIK